MRFTGQIRVPEVDHPGVPATFLIDDVQAEVVLKGESLGRWSLFDVHARRLVSSAFQVDLAGEEITFIADDPIDFAYRGVEHMAEVWARFKSMNVARRPIAVARSRRGTTPSKIGELRDVMMENLEAEHGGFFTDRSPTAPNEITAKSVAKEIEALSKGEDQLDSEAGKKSGSDTTGNQAQIPVVEQASSDDSHETQPADAEDLELVKAEHAQLEAEKSAIEEERANLDAERQSLETHRLEAEKKEADRVEAFRLEMRRLETERSEQKQIEVERAETYRLEMEKLEAERTGVSRLEAEHRERERAGLERLEASKNEILQLERKRVELERTEADRIAAAKQEAESLKAKRKDIERLESERVEREQVDKERSKAIQAEMARLETKRVEAERLEADQLAKAEAAETESVEQEQDETGKHEHEVVEELLATSGVSEDPEVSKQLVVDLGKFEEPGGEKEVGVDGQPESVLTGAPKEKSGIIGAVRGAFSRSGRNHEHVFVEAPGGIGIGRSICEDCGFVSISSSD